MRIDQYFCRSTEEPNRSPFMPFQRHASLLLCTILLCSLPLFSSFGWTASKQPPSLVEKQYSQAKAYYQNLVGTERGKSRKNWLTGADSFRKLYKANPDHPLAPSCLFMLGRMYYDMYARSGNPLDLGEAITYFEDVAALFPKQRLADDALYAIGMIYLTDKQDSEKAAKTFARVVALFPDGDMASAAATQLHKLKDVTLARDVPASPDAATIQEVAPAAGEAAPPAAPDQTASCKKATVLPIRYWSNNNYTRVVIETTEPVQFQHQMLDKHGDQPRRLYVNLINCRISPAAENTVPIQDGLLRQVRNAQFSPETVRVVLDTQSDITDYKIFSLEEPFRVVIDVKGERQVPSKTTSNTSPPSLAQQLGLGIKRIVLDPGHGGKDPGTISPGGLKEKDIVLKVAKKIAAKLRSELGYEVILTRETDVFIPLEERTAIANSKEGDLFISIHVNAAPSRNVNGIETYVLDLATNKDAMRVAALENSTSAKQLSDLQKILMDLIQNSKINESVKLAEFVQDSMITGLSQQYRVVNNLGVKKAPFIVLIGAQMPAILTEIAFSSNPTEEKRLRSDQYLTSVADHIVGGVSQYVTNLNLAGYY